MRSEHLVGLLRRLNWPARLGLAALVVTAAAGALWVGGTILAPDDRIWARIQSERVLRVATDASYPPFSAVGPDGALYGLDVDLANALGDRLDVTVRIENITYDALLQALASERADLVISAFVADLNQLDDAAYSEPYFVSGLRAVVPHDDPGELDSLAPWTWAQARVLGVEYGSMGDVLSRQWARRVAGLTVERYETAADALDALLAGEVTAVLADAVTAHAYVGAHDAVRLSGPALDPEPYVIATGARSPQLLREVNRILAELEADGTLSALRQKHLGINND